MNDTELFDLCKEVYKRTGWTTVSFISNPQDAKDKEYLYTSDYLLEKLPRKVEDRYETDHEGSVNVTATIADNKTWFASYGGSLSDPIYDAKSNTPLKALLKLVIALDDAKELN